MSSICGEKQGEEERIVMDQADKERELRPDSRR